MAQSLPTSTNIARVFIGACASSVIISHCSNTTFTLATREFYAQHTQGCTFLLYCATPPEVAAATCHNLSFGPFNGVYEQHAEHMEAAGLHPDGTSLPP
ncbi:tubulin-binding cofactor c, partial [Nannochloropsis oceanica]